MCTYNRPALMVQAVEALRRQTYENLEIILINNGGTPEAKQHLLDFAAADSRIKLMHFRENQYSPDDPSQYLDVCFNPALALATGDYVWGQSDDDFMADDYVEKMVALFQGNPECTTAAGLAVSINGEGKINEVQYDAKNLRPRYMPGHELALDCVIGTRTMFNAPGTIFTIKRDVLVQAGGFHRSIEFSHMFGIVPFGVTGFDPSAKFYWRHHQDQMNIQTSGVGWIGLDEKFQVVKDWKLEQRWSVFGKDVARSVIVAVTRESCADAAGWVVRHLYAFKAKPAFRLIRKMWFRPHFWYQTLINARRKEYYMDAVSPIMKPPIKRVFQIWPGLANLTPSLERLRQRANHTPPRLR